MTAPRGTKPATRVRRPLAIPGDLVHFHSRDGLALSGFLRRTRPSARSVVVHVHGMGGSFHTLPEMHGWFQGALSLGWDVFAVNTRGEAVEGVLKRGRGWVPSGTAVENFEDCTKDIAGAVDAVRSLGYSRILLSGHSTGCQKVTYYLSASQDRSILGVILLAPVDDYAAFRKDLGKSHRRWKLEAKRMVEVGQGDWFLPREPGVPVMTAQRFNSVSDLEREEARLFDYKGGELRRFSSIKCPVLAVFGSREENTALPVDECLRRLQSRSRSPFEGKVVSGADHDFQGKGGLVSAEIGGWLRRTFGPRGEA